jgi:hypothetical protein
MTTAQQRVQLAINEAWSRRTDLSANRSDPSAKWVMVTPKMAQDWLDNFNTKNRTLNKPYSVRMARDIVAGDWRENHHGIAFSVDGTLLDGQHRLQAIVIADRPVRMLVWTGVSKEALLTIDTGRPRNALDNLLLEDGSRDLYSKHTISTLRAMLRGPASGKCLMTTTQVKSELEKHADAIRFALECQPPSLSSCSISTTRGVIARAWYTQDRGAIAEFAECLNTGIVQDRSHRHVIQLRDYLMQNKAYNVGAITRMRYLKVSRSLWAYLNGETLTKLYAAPREYFPLPGEGNQ